MSVEIFGKISYRYKTINMILSIFRKHERGILGTSFIVIKSDSQRWWKMFLK